MGVNSVAVSWGGKIRPVVGQKTQLQFNREGSGENAEKHKERNVRNN